MADQTGRVSLNQLLGPGSYKVFKSDRQHLLFHCHICDHGCGRPDELQRHVKLMHPTEWTAMNGDFNYDAITVWTKNKTSGVEKKVGARQYRKQLWRSQEMPIRSFRPGLNRKARPAMGIRKQTNALYPGGLLNGRPVCDKSRVAAAKSRVAAANAVIDAAAAVASAAVGVATAALRAVAVARAAVAEEKEEGEEEDDEMEEDDEEEEEEDEEEDEDEDDVDDDSEA